MSQELIIGLVSVSDRASSGVHSCAVPLACAARPPLLAISR